MSDKKSSLRKSIFADLSVEGIIQSIFKKHPILVHTSKESEHYVPEEYSLYHHYKNAVKEINKKIDETDFKERKDIKPLEKLEIRGYQKVLNVLNSLTTNGFIIPLNKLIPEERKITRYRYSRIIKSFKPKFREVGNDYEFVKDEGLPEDIDRIFSARVFILADGNKRRAMKTLLKTIENKKKEYIRTYEEMPLETYEEAKYVKNWKKDLYEFKNQPLATEEESIKEYYYDIINFLGEMFHRQCPNPDCSIKILTPNNDGEQPIKNRKRYKELKKQQEIYKMSYDEAKENSKHPLSNTENYPNQTKEDFLEIRKRIRETYYTCQNEECGADLRKQPLFHMEEVINNWIIGLTANKQPILFGYPDDRTIQFYGGMRWKVLNFPAVASVS
jgi:hypothetical protein